MCRCQGEFVKDYMEDLDKNAYDAKLSMAASEEDKKNITQGDILFEIYIVDSSLDRSELLLSNPDVCCRVGGPGDEAAPALAG